MLESPLGRTRVLLHSFLTSPRGDALPPLRLARRALAAVNDLAGRPLCSAEELAERQRRIQEAEAALAARTGAAVAAAAPKAEPREAAPVVVYVDDQDHRTRKKVEEILKARDIPFKINDVSDDYSSRSWAMTMAKKTELPLVFVAGEPIGDLHELTQADVSGELCRRVFGR